MLGGLVVYGVLSAERTLMEQGLEQKRLLSEAKRAGRAKGSAEFLQRVSRFVHGIDGNDSTGSHSAAFDRQLAA